MSKPSQANAQDTHSSANSTKPERICGIVRPIAEMGSYSAKHWREVHSVVSEAVEKVGFTLRLVSESDASGVILTEIVSNLYQDEIVIVDVSGRNPNVMFELGMRLAFEKPAIIIMDDDTPFSFDISPVKHIRYPRTLRYSEILEFKDELSASVKATLELSPEKKNYLQQFGPVKVTELGGRSTNLDALANDVQEIKRAVFSTLNVRNEFVLDGLSLNHHRQDSLISFKNKGPVKSEVEVEISPEKFTDLTKRIAGHPALVSAAQNGDKVKVVISSSSPDEHSELRNLVRSVARDLRLS